jgi:hypothetical protein
VGAPPEVVARLAASRQEFEARRRSSVTSRESSKDPELDQFMVIIYSHDEFISYLEIYLFWTKQNYHLSAYIIL